MANSAMGDHPSAHVLTTAVLHVQAKSRVLELICKDIRDRYKALDLPPDMPLPPSTAPEGETLAAMTARADPDTRRIVEAGQKVLAMLAAISQLSKEALQVRHAAKSCSA